MKTNTIVSLIVAGIVLFFALILVSMKISYNNKEKTLRNLVEAQTQSNEANFDKMFKVIQQIAQTADASKEAFKEIYIPLMEGRYSGEKGNALMKWVTESNPNFDLSLYKKLAEAIESNRDEFFNEQKKLIDYNLSHTNLIQTFPGSFFCSNKEKIDIHLVTSAKTKEVFKSGEENNIDLGLGKKK